MTNRVSDTERKSITDMYDKNPYGSVSSICKKHKRSYSCVAKILAEHRKSLSEIEKDKAIPASVSFKEYLYSDEYVEARKCLAEETESAREHLEYKSTVNRAMEAAEGTIFFLREALENIVRANDNEKKLRDSAREIADFHKGENR